MAAKYSDTELFRGVRKRNTKVLNYIYKHFYPFVENYIISNSGNIEDSQDIFQEALIILYRKLKQDEVDTNTNFTAYIYNIVKFIWLKKLRSEKYEQTYNQTLKSNENVVNDISETYILNEKYKLYQKHLQKLDKLCQQILKLQLQKLSYEEIAEKLGYKDAEYIKSKKYKCKEALVRNIKNDPEYRDIFLDDFLEI